MKLNSPLCVGLDLAWSERNRTGGAALRDGRLLTAVGDLSDDASIVAFIGNHLVGEEPVVIGIDAPLCVPNQSGRRPADHAVSLAWGRFEAGAYPANRVLLGRNGKVRGEELALALAARFGCAQTAPIPHRGNGRYVCEVFPHPAHIALFDLPRTLKYKRKPGRSREQIDAEFVRYQRLLAGLREADPPLFGQETLVGADASQRRGRALQEFEETLDAVTCAYVVWYAWWHGPARQRVYGTVAEGHILVPWPPHMTERPKE